MKYALLAIVIVLATLAAGVGYLWYRLRALAARPETADFMKHLDDGLAIPMRDSDTRPRRQAHQAATPAAKGN